MKKLINIYIMMKAAPPFSPTRYGKRHRFPSPTAEPAIATRAPKRLPKLSLFIFYKFKGVSGLLIGEKVGALAHLPYSRVYRREECIGILDDRMYMGHHQPVCRRKRLGIYLTASHDETFFQIGGFRNFICLLERTDHFNFFAGGKASGNHDIDPAGKRTAYGFESLAAHDDRAAESGPPEETHIFRNMPQEGIVLSYGIVVCYRYYDVLLHNYTATGAGMRGYGS